jgi:hypothetical protein
MRATDMPRGGQFTEPPGRLGYACNVVALRQVNRPPYRFRMARVVFLEK